MAERMLSATLVRGVVAQFPHCAKWRLFVGFRTDERGPSAQKKPCGVFSNAGFSFVISYESPNGPGFRGRGGYVASWRRAIGGQRRGQDRRLALQNACRSRAGLQRHPKASDKRSCKGGPIRAAAYNSLVGHIIRGGPNVDQVTGPLAFGLLRLVRTQTPVFRSYQTGADPCSQRPV